MGNSVTTNPQRRENNPDDALDAVIQINDACVFRGSGGESQAAGLIPDNGEYSWAGTTGSCAVCSICAPKRMAKSDGSCDGSGNCGWEGTIPQYKRTSYSAPIDDCCLQQVKTINNKTCDPKYKDGYLTDNCNSTLSNYCSKKGSSALSDEKCKLWLNRVGTTGDIVLNNVCVGDSLTSDICQNWCARNPINCATNFKDYCKTGSMLEKGSYCRTKSLEPGFEIDEPVGNFCAEHPNDEYCACYKAINDSTSEAAKKDPVIRSILARPECYVTTCASGLAYQTKNMRNNLKTQGCPNVNVCQNTLNSLGNTSSNLNNITQRCDQSQTESLQPNEVSESKSQSQDVLSQIENMDKNYFAIFLLIILVISLGVQSSANKKAPFVSVQRAT